MDLWTFIIAVVALGICGDIIKRYIDKREVRNDSETDDLLRELEALTERVQILEEIVTDDRHRLKQDIAELERA